MIFLFIVVQVLFEIPEISSTSSKSCKTFKDYSLLTKYFGKPNCWYNPDVNLNTAQIISRNGYPSETHTVITEDGYILTMNRIPFGKNGSKSSADRKSVLLQHGLLGSSASFVISGNQSLAFILADRGFDVWLGNFRGNIYSRGHIDRDPEGDEFWDFSFHEIGKYDVKAQVDYVIEKTSNTHRKLIYIGHSMGTTAFFVYSSLYPEKSRETVTAMFAFAPVAFMKSMKIHFKGLSYFSKLIKFFADMTDIHEILPSNDLMKLVKTYGCEKSMTQIKICEFLQFIKFGFSSEQLQPNLLAVILAHQPAGSSLKTFEHFGQEIKNNGKFQHFDYGKHNNFIFYGSITPPEYNLSQIQTPIYLMYSENDYLSSTESVLKLYDKLPENIRLGIYRVPDRKFNHIDFLWARDVKRLLYDHLVEQLDKVQIKIINWDIEDMTLAMSATN